MIRYRISRLPNPRKLQSARCLQVHKHESQFKLCPGSRWRSSISCATRSQSKGNYDCIFVLGGGLKEDGRLPKWVVSRLELAADLLQDQGEECMVLCLGGGTPHKPAITVNGHVLHEAAACANFLLQKGFSARRILKETASYDTVGNGYFATTMHAIPAQWSECALVTSNFHLARSQAIFRKCFELANLSQCKQHGQLRLSCHGAPDEDAMSEEVLDMRNEKELKSLRDWEKAAESIHSLQELHRWLHETHLCYSVSRQEELFRKLGATENPVLMASY